MTKSTLPEDWYASPRPLPHRWLWKLVPGDKNHWIAEALHSGLMAEIHTAQGRWIATVGEAIRKSSLYGMRVLGRTVTVTGFDTRRAAVQAAERSAVAAGIAIGRE